jgi:hypothetical protein
MAKRKRRPGGGRKPSGEFPGKYATFTTRIQPETRRALDEATRKSRHRSVSATAEFILKQGLKKPSGEPRNHSLACAVAILAERIEQAAGERWRQDQFTGLALRYAVEALLFHFAPTPEGVPAVPPAVEKAAEKMPPEFAERFRKPAGLGHTLAFNLIQELEQARSTATPNEWSLPIFFSEEPAQLGLISRDLGLTESKKGKSK